MLHASHPNIIKRLKRAEGHLRSVIEMFAQGRSCNDLAQQLHAVESAVSSAKRELIHDHIENCLDDPRANDTGTLRELKALAKYL
jgi:hypothetical protein NreA